MRLHQYAAINHNRSYPFVEANDAGLEVGSIFGQLNKANLSLQEGGILLSARQPDAFNNLLPRGTSRP